jgi:hypothetical protein
MPTAGQLPGVYNIVKQDEYETVPDQLSVESFINELNDQKIREEVTVVGLEHAFKDDELIAELAQTIKREAETLESADPTPMIQFAVDAEIHRGPQAFDLFYEGNLYSLHEVFGRQFKTPGGDNNWLTAPF